MRLVYFRRRNKGKIEKVTVPPELEPFAEYLLEKGYNESTVAYIVSNAKKILKQGLSEQELELMSGKRARKLRYAYRFYKEFSQRNKGVRVTSSQASSTTRRKRFSKRFSKRLGGSSDGDQKGL
ncbi:MAG: hypothetical protein J7K48_08015 [Thermococcus sp.]|nr:hypothetical protein [Thermococcus sp.]